MICQTTLALQFRGFRGCYDVLIPLILVMGFSLPARSGFMPALLLGFFMDGLTGGGFGIYLSAYGWIFLCIRWFRAVFETRNYIITTMAICIAVLFENIISLIGGTFFFTGKPFFSDTGYYVFLSLVSQLLWAIATGYFLILMIIFAKKYWDGRWRKIMDWTKTIAYGAIISKNG